MSSVDAADPTLDDVISRARALPAWLGALRVETHGWSDVALSMLASDRARALLRSSSQATKETARVEQRVVRSWMTFAEGSWHHAMFDVLPQRWREEIETTDGVGAVRRVISAHNEDVYWQDDGRGAKAYDGRRQQRSLANGWVVGTRWTSASAARELLGGASVIGRAGLRVRLVVGPEPRRRRPPFSVGDAHELVIDVATGMTLAVTSWIDDAPFRHDEVSAIEPDATIAAALTAVPEGAEMIPPSSFRAPRDVAIAAPGLTLLSPTWLPTNFVFQTGHASVDDADVPHASLIFSRDRRAFVTLRQRPESQPFGEETYQWHHIERGPRTVFITDLTNAPGERIARTTMSGTVTIIHAELSAPELLEIAFSLQEVEP